MTIPSTRDVDLALHLELVRAGRPVRRVETYDGVARHFPNLTPEDRAKTRKDGVSKVFTNMVNWSRNRLRVRGLLDDQLAQGQWKAMPDARAALLDDIVARGATRRRAEQFIGGSETLADLLGRDWAKPLRLQGGGREPDVPDAPREPEPLSRGRPELAEADATQTVKQTMLARLNAMGWYEFEQFVGRLLDSLGFRDTQVVGRSGDEGVDVITYLHSPFVTAKVAVQVKRHTNNVGPRDVSYLRDRWARRADRLLFITTSDFTSGAREVAADDHDKPVDLVSGDRLVDVMIEHELGVRVRPQVVYEIDDSFFST